MIRSQKPFSLLLSYSLSRLLEAARLLASPVENSALFLHSLYSMVCGSECYRETARVRVAPWMMPCHLETAEKVYVVNYFFSASDNNDKFRNDLRPLVSAAGASLIEYSELDVWMQDYMEFGYANLPKHGFRTVVQAPRNRPSKAYPLSLLDADLGIKKVGTMVPSSTFDSTGNLEVTPP